MHKRNFENHTENVSVVVHAGQAGWAGLGLCLPPVAAATIIELAVEW